MNRDDTTSVKKINRMKTYYRKIYKYLNIKNIKKGEYKST